MSEFSELTDQRARKIRRVLAGKARRYPQLSRALTWNSLRRVLESEEIAVETMSIIRPARLVGFNGVWTIILSSNFPTRRHTYYAAHELGHVWLHVDDAGGRDVCSYHFDRDDSPDPREEEAETVATWLLGNPEVRRFLDVPQSPAGTIAPPGMSLLEALATKRVVRGIDIAPPTPPAPRPLAKPQRADSLAREIENADSLAALIHLRSRVLVELANDARRRTVLRQIDVREDELLEILVWPTRRP